MGGASYTLRFKGWFLCILLLLAVGVLARPEISLGNMRSDTWTEPVPIVKGLAFAAAPSVAYGSDGSAHAVWETNGTLFYASQSSQDAPNGMWSQSQAVAMGVMPSLAAGADGSLFLAFSHEFMGNDEIYFVVRPAGSERWTLPVNVSHTSGRSLMPSLTLTQDANRLNRLNVAWMDNSPGDWVIYSGALADSFWSSLPVPNARGETPILAADPYNTLYLAWQANQNRDNAEDTDILLSQPVSGGWTIPINVSDTPGTPSVDVTVVGLSDGLAHLSWLERRQNATDQWTDIYYAYGRDIQWSPPQFVASSTELIQQPRMTTDHSALLAITWVQGQTLQATFGAPRSGTWQAPSPVVSPGVSDLRDIAVSAKPRGGVSVSWVQANAAGAGEIAVYESSHASVLTTQSWLPLLIHP